MATATGSSTLVFPSKEIMIQYLSNQEVLANDDYLNETGVVEKIAQIFASTTKTPREVQNGIVKTLNSIGLNGSALVTTYINIRVCCSRLCARESS
jgi:hypothetical protein